MEWIASELASCAKAAMDGATWCTIFWAFTEFLGSRPPHWTESLVFVAMAAVLGLLSLFVKGLSQRVRRVA